MTSVSTPSVDSGRAGRASALLVNRTKRVESRLAKHARIVEPPAAIERRDRLHLVGRQLEIEQGQILGQPLAAATSWARWPCRAALPTAARPGPAILPSRRAAAVTAGCRRTESSPRAPCPARRTTSEPQRRKAGDGDPRLAAETAAASPASDRDAARLATPPGVIRA